jgi:hypothetical protein
MNGTRSALSASALALVASVLLAAPASAQLDFDIDHFKCYYPQLPVQNFQVFLKDQFDPAAGPREDTIVRRPVRFCAPTDKQRLDTGQITTRINPFSHLKLYLIAPSELEPTRKVVVQNQFGRKALTVYQSEVLAVPAQKNDELPPVNLDHFKCYRAYGGSINVRVKLTDQFGASEHQVFRPFGLCNPVEKQHGTVVTPIKNPRDHLVCYKITPQTVGITVRVRDQFFPNFQSMVLTRADLLCVPSLKVRVTEINP